MKQNSYLNKRKIFNDPVYGFINITDDLVFDIIEHPYFQRLRRIQQLGLTCLVYPGATHTRFHHALGSMHLMLQALETLKTKGQCISCDEETAAVIAILLHDIGHGPFSHTLENNIIPDVNHVMLSDLFFDRFNILYDGKLNTAINIYRDSYPLKFLHQLVSSQLDMDRLDYLKRDSYYTGVPEGIPGTERIIKMLNVHEGNLVVDAKGIYSIEKFIVARRLMYWQVYLHKTVIAAEYLLINIIKRASMLALKGEEVFASPPLKKFLYNKYTFEDFKNDAVLLDDFAQLDDSDLIVAIKMWINHSDKILSLLSKNLVYRHLPSVELSEKPFDKNYIDNIKNNVSNTYKIDYEDTDFFVISGTITNYAYNPEQDNIRILYPDGKVVDIIDASEHFVAFLTDEISRYFLFYPRIEKFNK